MAFSIYTVSFNGNRAEIVRASSSADAATVASLAQYEYLNRPLAIVPYSTGRTLWDVKDAETGAIVGSCAVHKPQAQRAYYEKWQLKRTFTA